MRKIPLLAAIFFGLSTAAASAQDWKPIQDVLGRKGKVDEGILRITFPRSDLKVSLKGIPVPADLALDTWYGFWPQPDGKMMLMGDTVVQESELAGVLEEVRRQGLEITAIHNHLAGETPHILFTHMSGMGDGVDLARKAKAVLARTKAPTGEEPEKKKSTVDWSAVTSMLGKPAETEGTMIEFAFQRAEKLSMMGHDMPSTDALETAPEVKLNMLKDGKAVSYGEMILVADEVNPVFQALTEHGMTVNALHNHMVREEPRLFFMHWWGVGQPKELATGLRAALDKMNVRNASKE